MNLIYWYWFLLNISSTKLLIWLFILFFIPMYRRLSLLLISIAFLLSGCWKDQKSIGDLIPATWWVVQKTDDVNQPQLVTGAWVSSMPDRVKGLGFVEPEWMTLNTLSSRQTTQAVEGYNSVSLVYSWSYDTAMAQAKLIAEKVWLPVGKEFAMAQELLANNAEVSTSMQDEFKGIVYTNHSLTDTRVDMVESITVEEDGRLIIDVVDYAAMQKK